MSEAAVKEGDIAAFLQYWGLKENPAVGRDFVHTDLVDRIVDEVKANQGIWLLGEAGAGKSATMREVRDKLYKLDNGYIATIVKFNWLVDQQTKTRITHGGLISLGYDLIDELDAFFKHQQDAGKKDSWPTASGEHRRWLKEQADKLTEQERFYHLRKLFGKLKIDGYKPVIVLDDADSLQYFTDFNNLNDLMDMSQSAIFCCKPSVEKALQYEAVHKDENQTHTQLAADRERLVAFLRRCTKVYVRGQLPTTMLRIVRGKLSKRDNIITDEALAWGFAAAYCEDKSKSRTIDDFSTEAVVSNQNTMLYNPHIVGIFLKNCLVIGADREAKKIDTDIAREAYRETITGLRTYDRVDKVDIETHLEEIQKARTELAKVKF
jgi:hypothetical protein